MRNNEKFHLIYLFKPFLECFGFTFVAGHTVVDRMIVRSHQIAAAAAVVAVAGRIRTVVAVAVAARIEAGIRTVAVVHRIVLDLRIAVVGADLGTFAGSKFGCAAGTK